MSDRIPRRRWWLVLAIGVVLAVVGAPFAWWYRPLTATERQLVGTWHLEGGPPSNYETFLFTSGREFTCISEIRGGAFEKGTWHGADGMVFLFTPSPVRPSWNTLEVYVKLAFSGQLHDDAGSFRVEFEGPDLLRMMAPDGGLYSVWKRVP